MAKILCIETSTEVCSVAIAENGHVCTYLEDRGGQSHSTLLTVFIDQLAKSGHEISSLDAVAISEGPGSYTGLRIGTSVAKGLCFGAGIKLIAVSPLAAMASHVANNAEKYGLSLSQTDLLVPMIDARRMEVYTSVFDKELNAIAPVEALVIDESSFESHADNSRLLLFGNGANKCKSVLNSSSFVYIEDIYTSAQHMALLAQELYDKQVFANVAYFEPFYLKEFIATVPKNKVI
jgi:tRNA threonylcarbamoyladenosine biosynthesis protein TsaB